LPGITVDLAGTQVRVLVPGLVSELDPRISRLQVGGTDVPPDEPAGSVAAPGAGLAVLLAAGTSMTLGKAMAQAGHAGMIAVALLAGDDQAALARWRSAGCPADARQASPVEWVSLTAELADERRAWQEQRLLAVRDAGFTEVEPGTVTVIARSPRLP
jgi:peptidyl-tRNA hydrolase